MGRWPSSAISRRRLVRRAAASVRNSRAPSAVASSHKRSTSPGGAQYRYVRCIDGHGVFITVFDFLRSRGLVRGLSAMELQALREQLSSVSCPGCGAPVDLDGDAACSYCGTVVSIVDTEHLATALHQLQQESPAPAPVTGPTLAEEDVVALWRADLRPPDDEEWGRVFDRRRPVDLLDLGMSALSSLMRRRR